jgi:hypothetical protein
LWNSFVSLAINIERKYVQLEDRYLGNWNFGLLTLLCGQSFQDKEERRLIKDRYIGFHHENRVSGVKGLHHFYTEKGSEQTTGGCSNKAARFYKKVQGFGHFLRNMLVGVQEISEYVQIVHKMRINSMNLITKCMCFFIFITNKFHKQTYLINKHIKIKRLTLIR